MNVQGIALPNMLASSDCLRFRSHIIISIIFHLRVRQIIFSKHLLFWKWWVEFILLCRGVSEIWNIRKKHSMIDIKRECCSETYTITELDFHYFSILKLRMVLWHAASKWYSRVPTEHCVEFF